MNYRTITFFALLAHYNLIGKYMKYSAINWNKIEDEKDKEVWDRVTANFWLDTKIPLSNDLKSWATLSENDKNLTKKVFGGLTLLDTLQSTIGVSSLVGDAATAHEVAVYDNFNFMEAVHTKSYSSIFSTLCSSKEIEEIFEWVEENPYLQKKAHLVSSHYVGSDPLMKKAASVALESMLFYSGFYMPMYWVSRAKLTNTADIIKLIIADEAIHGYYIGYKFQVAYAKLDTLPRLKVYSNVMKLFEELYDNEIRYINDLYDGSGLAEDVKRFLNYNYNKAMQNLGFEGKFSGKDIEVNAAILSALAPGENHDFFSGSGSSYEMAVIEQTNDDDWEF
jgi:ribonucleoside-diphosphate reductase beta chain